MSQKISYSLLLTLGLLAPPVQAQIATDGTVGTIVTPSGNTFTITGGTTSGTNLFHSFSQFSVPTGGAAIFDNNTNIANIFSRVTGSSASNIDGKIQAAGTANLFLLNPNGIIFGANSSLQIGGSFLATTANSIQFADGVEFSATNSSLSPLLTISVPIGLQFGQNSGDIAVRGSGHNITSNNAFVSPIRRSGSVSGLRVSPGRTFALVGGSVNLEGGAIVANSGHIELGSVDSGIVHLNPTSLGWKFGYEGVQNFRDISLSQRSLLEASGFLGGGSIQIQASRFTLSDGSTALIQNFSSQPSGSIRISATELVDFGRPLPTAGIVNGLINETLGAGRGGNIEITTQRLTFTESGIIMTRTLSGANGGDIIVNASDSVRFQSAQSSSSLIVSAALRAGNAGDITLSTKRLTAAGGNISTPTLGFGNSGNLTINATESIDLFGADRGSQGAILAVSTFNSGDAGQLTINTPRLRVQEGSIISSSTFSRGTAGQILINASESVEISGSDSQTGELSLIKSSADIPSPGIRQFLRLSPIVDGVSGNVTINTPRLSVTDGAEISVSHAGSNSAGDVKINANSVFLDRGGRVIASTSSGEGGNLNLQLRDVLVMRNNSLISTNAGGTGNGGNITIQSPFIVAVPTENSDITANAFAGNGGNIQIATNGIFGLQFRPQLTPLSDITASSQLGVSGIVNISEFITDPSSGLTELSTTLADSSTQIKSDCSASQGGKFIVTGRGGLPPNPDERLQSDRAWVDIRDLSEFRGEKTAVEGQRAESFEMQGVEANSWRVNEAGNVELVAVVSNTEAQTPTVDCAGVPLTISFSQ
ncbi:S-layer family protein [Lusitaniella coriacea LEGE 07157]|uniref:S-layer family protein n=1 Tax=Lusitaniella coriacea LEGE 07157 TaxID=945747 RepID=A0A8J7AN03_9CYAN|nr:S-layer family protein [Lusitaniella coriacea]MBE9114828.1 S-layer family protein [Lusitaniella coriacea LEGE 07157]